MHKRVEGLNKRQGGQRGARGHEPAKASQPSAFFACGGDKQACAHAWLQQYTSLPSSRRAQLAAAAQHPGQAPQPNAEHVDVLMVDFTEDVDACHS